MSEPSRSEIPEVEDRRPVLQNLLPRNAQTRFLAAVALLMVIVILLSGRTAPKPRSAPSGPPPMNVSDPNQARIREFQDLLERQTQQLAREEAQLAQTKQTLGVPAAPNPSATPVSAVTASSYRPEPAQSAMAADRAKREYESLFASNVALSYRTAPGREPGRDAAPAMVEPESTARNDSIPVGSIAAKSYRLPEGTFLETVLTNRLDASFAGPVNCMVTTDVYSLDHAALLIPTGTRVLGEVHKVEAQGQQRLSVTFHRLLMPNGSSVKLEHVDGLSQAGETGLRDQINHHYLQIFGASIAIGAIAGLSQANTRYGLDESAADAYRLGVANSLSQSSMHVLDRFLNVLPTFTVREGHRIKVYLSQDINLPPYE
jgi:type IV secretion system protein VirB10